MLPVSMVHVSIDLVARSTEVQVRRKVTVNPIELTSSWHLTMPLGFDVCRKKLITYRN